MKISCKFGEPSWCSFPARVLTPKFSMRGIGGSGIANAKPKYPPVAAILIFLIRETCLKYDGCTHFGRAKVKDHTMMHTYNRSMVKSTISHNKAADLHTLTNVTTKYQLPTPYDFRDKTRFYNLR